MLNNLHQMHLKLIQKVSRTLPQIKSKTVTNEIENIGVDRDIPNERYIAPEIKQKVIDNLRITQ